MPTKAKTILSQPIKNEPLITREEAEDTARHVIGHHFTGAYIASLRNPKLKDFTADAESCLEKAQDWDHRAFWLGFWRVFAVFSAIASFMLYKQGGWVFATACAVTVVIAVIAMIYKGVAIFVDAEPSVTERMVARAWERGVRNKTLFHSIARNLAAQIRYEEDRGHIDNVRYQYYGTNWLQKALEFVLDQELEKYANVVKEAELHQDPSKKEFGRSSFAQINHIGQLLGFEQADWKMIDRQQ